MEALNFRFYPAGAVRFIGSNNQERSLLRSFKNLNEALYAGQLAITLLPALLGAKKTPPKCDF